jgi:hypothetical protein
MILDERRETSNRESRLRQKCNLLHARRRMMAGIILDIIFFGWRSKYLANSKIESTSAAENRAGFPEPITV